VEGSSEGKVSNLSEAIRTILRWHYPPDKERKPFLPNLPMPPLPIQSSTILSHQEENLSPVLPPTLPPVALPAPPPELSLSHKWQSEGNDAKAHTITGLLHTNLRLSKERVWQHQLSSRRDLSSEPTPKKAPESSHELFLTACTADKEGAEG